MMVKIRALGYIAEVLGSRELTLNIDKKVKVRELIKLPKDVESRVIILINGKPATLDSEVYNKDQILIVPMISGG